MEHTEHIVSERELPEQVGRNHRTTLALGIFTVLLGVLAIVFPMTATFATELALGVLITAAGIVQLVHAFRVRGWSGSLVDGIGGVLALAVGLLLLFYPLTGVLTLTFLLGVWFFLAGVLRSATALRLRPLDGWGWLLFAGLLAIALGIAVLVVWPEASVWLLGLFVGIDLIFFGAWMIIVANAAKRTFSA